MSRFLLIIILILLSYYLIKSFIKDISLSKKKSNPKDDSEELVKDPYCEKYIPKSLALKRKINGITHFFCSESCMKNYTSYLLKK